MEDDTKMAQEQEDQSRNNCINGGSRSTKKPKQKKVPQRGLGVAQLEKILEEQSSQNVTPSPSSSTTISSFLPLPINNFNHSNHMKEGTFILPSPNSTSLSSSSTTISHYLPPPITNYNLMNQNSSSGHLPLPSLGEFRSSMSMQHLDGNNGKVPSTVSLPNNGVFGNVPKLWNSHELDFEKENGLPFLPSLPFDSNQIWPMPNWVQRTQFHHQHSSQLVNNSAGTSSTHVPQLSIEPPSNQNHSINGGTPARPAEKMMIGMKRPYPFSLDFPQAPALTYKLPPPNAEIGGTNSRRTSCESESGFHFVAGNSTSRESQSCSASNSDPNSKRRDKGIKELDGNFLTLAPPSPVSLNNQESPEEHVEDRFHTGYKLARQQKQPLYSFIIPRETQNGQPALRIQNGHEVEENIDLNLKL
ncbi:unnamed protein product [Trifolium pratense]|uniref:Uncharacterized protein n=1 Tax=Trifolium pratense TaxID=57577 RepID=A0ACB0KU45_TRIPR|nr:unnamed protein product [Trifolium pratense]